MLNSHIRDKAVDGHDKDGSGAQRQKRKHIKKMPTQL